MGASIEVTRLSKTVSQLERQLADKQQEIDYYKNISRETGRKRLLEIHQMSKLIEAKKDADHERERVIRNLQTALEEVKILQGLIPICASCKKIRDDKGYWNQIESYIEEHSNAAFSHGLCPECLDKEYGDKAWYRRMKEKHNR